MTPNILTLLRFPAFLFLEAHISD